MSDGRCFETMNTNTLITCCAKIFTRPQNPPLDSCLPMVDNKESVVPQRSLSTKVSCQTVLRSASEQLQYTHPHHSWVRKAAGWVSSSAVRKCLSGAGGIGWVLPAIGRVRACMVLAFTLDGKELRSLARVHIN